MFIDLQNRMLRIGIACGAGALILIAVYFFPGRYIFTYRDRVKAEFQKSQDRLQQSHELVRNFANPQKAIEDIEKKAQELRDIGATARQLPKIVQSLAHPAGKLNINIISIRPREDIKTSEEALPSGVNKAHIEIVLRCPYKLLAEYLKAISQLPTTFIIERLSIEKKQGAPIPSEGSKIGDKQKDMPFELSVTLLVSTYLVWEI